MKMKSKYLLAFLGVPLLAGAAVIITSGIGGDSQGGDSHGDETRSLSTSTHWSYQPVTKPDQPYVHNKDWVSTPIDAFILQELEEKEIAPSPLADRATLIRRLSLDVLGVIPSPEEVESFVNDQSQDAYEKLVDRLLASSHYGERQARRWLDLARYADSGGFQNDDDRPNMWRYRDYVINAFNSDKPYDRFIQEQLAGDELWPGNEEALTATGFMAQYPDNSNSRDMVQRRYQIITDITDTVGQVVLGQTVQCARCHDHKFDSISQKEYFQLQAFFANVSAVDNIPVTDKTESELAYQQEMARWEEATREVQTRIDAIVQSDYDAAIEYYRTRFVDDTRESLAKPESEWSALDRWVNHRFESVTSPRRLTAIFEDKAASVDPEFHSDWHAEQWAELQKLNRELREFSHLKPSLSDSSPFISAMSELGHADAPPTYVLDSGEHTRPLEEVQPGFPAAITSAEPQIQPLSFSSGRRAALAQWLTSPDNPLTARVYVNRIWEQYFGRGIVESVSDFGKAGTRPDNPELLDYLAARLVDNNWSIKSLHREILLSSVYRQSSLEREELLEVDPQNRLLAVFPVQRLEAEQIRDSLLAAAGLLNEEIGGPSVFPPLPKNTDTGGSTYEGDGYWTVSGDEADHHRRSLYVFTRRSLPYPLLSVFNMSSPQQAHSQREVTTTPLQALALANSDLVFEWSQALAGRVLNEARGAEQDPLDRLYQILFARTPDADEKGVLTAFLQEQQKIVEEIRREGDMALPAGLQSAGAHPAADAAFVDLVHTVTSSNEFVYRL